MPYPWSLLRAPMNPSMRGQLMTYPWLLLRAPITPRMSGQLMTYPWSLLSAPMTPMMKGQLMTYPWSLLRAPMTPRMSGHPWRSLSPLLCKTWRTHSSCFCRMSDWGMSDSSCSGPRIIDCSFYKIHDTQTVMERNGENVIQRL